MHAFKFPAEIICAVIMCVYSGDSPVEFDLAVNSIRNQKLTPGLSVRLYLCVDGQISEEIEAVILAHGDAFHRLIRNCKNCGLAISLNRLIDSLEQEQYVARMDADDYSDPERLATQVNFFESHPEVDVVGTSISEVYESRLIGIRHYPESHSQCLAYLSKASPFAHPTVCFRRAVFGGDVKYPIKHQNEDIALWFLLANKGFIFSNIQKPLLNFRVTKNTFRRRSKAKAMGEFLIYKNGMQDLGHSQWKLIYPLMRLLFRMIFPGFLIGIIYRTDLRQRILNK